MLELVTKCHFPMLPFAASAFRLQATLARFDMAHKCSTMTSDLKY